MTPEKVQGPQKIPEGERVLEALGLNKEQWTATYFNQRFLGSGMKYVDHNASVLIEPVGHEDCFLLGFSKKEGKAFLSPRPGSSIGDQMVAKDGLRVVVNYLAPRGGIKEGPSLSLESSYDVIGFKRIRIWTPKSPAYQGILQEAKGFHFEDFDHGLVFIPGFDAEEGEWVLYIISTLFLNDNIALSPMTKAYFEKRLRGQSPVK